MRCPTCQHDVRGRFCPNCGTEVQRNAEASNPQGSARDPNATSVISAADLAAFAAARERESQSAPPSAADGAQEPLAPEGSSGQGFAPPPRYGQTTPPGQPGQSARSPDQTAPLYYTTAPPRGEQPLYGDTTPPPDGHALYGATTTPGAQPTEQPPGTYAPSSGEPPYGATATMAAPAGRRKRSPLLLVGLIVAALILLGAIAVAALVLFGSHDNGTIKFGTSYKDNGGAFQIQGARSSFSPSDKIAWVGYLNDSVDPKTLRRTIDLLPSGGPPRAVVNRAVTITSATSGTINRVATQASIADLESEGVNPPGTYRVTYAARGKKEAQGTFTLTGRPVAGKIFFGTSMTNALVTGLSTSTTFGSSGPFDFVAHFTHPAGVKKLSVRFFYIRSDGSEQQVSDNTVQDTIGDAGAWMSKNQLTMARLRDFGVTSRGTYFVRYFRGSQQLAEGRFTLR